MPSAYTISSLVRAAHVVAVSPATVMGSVPIMGAVANAATVFTKARLSILLRLNRINLAGIGQVGQAGRGLGLRLVFRPPLSAILIHKPPGEIETIGD